MDRVKYLDGHRGLAILLVVFYHAYIRWSELLPFTEQYKANFLLSHGYLGVQLFFLISGYVILLSLEKSSHFSIFIYKRWLRLFPCMLACSAIVFMTADFFPHRPLGSPELVSLIPGLLFIDPKWFETIFPINMPILEGAFWSLYVEFKFYIFAGLVFFWRGSKALVISLIICFISSIIINYLSITFNYRIFSYLDLLVTRLSFVHFGWFGAGCSFYLYSKTKKAKWFYLALIICFGSSFYLKNQTIGEIICAFGVSVFFAFSLRNTLIQCLLSTKFLLFFGMISYPLYLMHENMMVSMIISLYKIAPMVPSIFLPAIPILVISCLAFIIASYVESPLKHQIIEIFSVQKQNNNP